MKGNTAMKKLLINEENLGQMLEKDLLFYGVVPDKNDNRPSTLERAVALFTLTLHENQTKDGKCISRIIEHLSSFTAAEKAPNFDAICLWNYCPLSASIALARLTPTIWDKLSEELKERLSFIMEMFAYLESFATSDDNTYRTGPALGGNYCKTWNPNYRLANVPAIIFSACFFGQGDMELGAERVNKMLHAFDEEQYNRTIEKLDSYAWNRAKETWTTPARMHEDGTYGTDAKQILVYGGPTYSLDYTHSYVTKDAGTGLGVSNGGNDYRYFGIPLSDAAGIIENLLEFNYSGGEVKSEHRYDVDKDGVAERIAWIVGDLISPYQGKLGMMKEFASGNRSSTGYCSHDFTLTTVVIAAAWALNIYDVKTNPALWDIIKVGNGDFLYKNEKGYQCFATGSYGTSSKTHSEENEGTSYFALKSLWLDSLAD